MCRDYSRAFTGETALLRVEFSFSSTSPNFKQVFRQSDLQFVKLLNEMRVGMLSLDSIALLRVHLFLEDSSKFSFGICPSKSGAGPSQREIVNYGRH